MNRDSYRCEKRQRAHRGARRPPMRARLGWPTVGLVAMLAAGVALSACGSGSPSALGVASTAAPTARAGSGKASASTGRGNSAGAPGASSGATGGGSGASPASSATRGEAALKFARCMRAHGIANFPDPTGAGNFQFPATGLDRKSPAFTAAQSACRKDMPLPGVGGPAPTAQWMAHMLVVAQCMRAHGIVNFPDPRTTAPSSMAGVGEISDIEGAILVFPRGFDQQSAQFTKAAGACGFPLHNH